MRVARAGESTPDGAGPGTGPGAGPEAGEEVAPGGGEASLAPAADDEVPACLPRFCPFPTQTKQGGKGTLDLNIEAKKQTNFC